MNCIKCVRGDRPHTTHYECPECRVGNHKECTVKFGCCCGCERCGAPVKTNQAKYCSQACSWASKRKSRPGCIVCGKPVKRRRALCCSHACHSASMCRPKPECGECGKPAPLHGMKYCSLECYNLARRPAPKPDCAVCGKTVKQLARKYCSRDCFQTVQPRTVVGETMLRAKRCLAERDTPASCFIVAQHKAGEAMPVFNEHTGQGRFLLFADRDAELWQDFAADDITGTYLIGSKKAVVLC